MRINFNLKNITSNALGLVLVLVCLMLANLFSNFFLGFLTAMGGNISIGGFNKIEFDPLITIAYMMLFYFMTIYFQPKHQLALFLFTLFLSFTVNFIQGSIFLVVFYFLLRKFKLV